MFVERGYKERILRVWVSRIGVMGFKRFYRVNRKRIRWFRDYGLDR